VVRAASVFLTAHDDAEGLIALAQVVIRTDVMKLAFVEIGAVGSLAGFLVLADEIRPAKNVLAEIVL